MPRFSIVSRSFQVRHIVTDSLESDMLDRSMLCPYPSHITQNFTCGRTMLAVLVAVCVLFISCCLFATSLLPGRSRRYSSFPAHESRLRQVLSSLEDRPPGSKLSLHRRTSSSNTIRNASHQSDASYHPVDLSSFHHILEINLDPTDDDGGDPGPAPYVICEPGILISDLVRELLRQGVTLPVVWNYQG